MYSAQCDLRITSYSRHYYYYHLQRELVEKEKELKRREIAQIKIASSDSQW